MSHQQDLVQPRRQRLQQHAARVRSHWASQLLSELSLAGLLGLGCLLLFRVRSGWSSVDTGLPYLYFADPLQYANAVFNAQMGNPFEGPTLGGPTGQQMGLSSYGVEWAPAWFAAQLASPENGPWQAQYRYWELSYVLVPMAAYAAARWLGVQRVVAAVAAVGFTFIFQHQNEFRILFYVSLVVLPFAIVLAIRMSAGSTFAELVPGKWPSTGRRRSILGAGLAALALLTALTGANYYMIFSFLLLGSAAALLLVRRRWWGRSARLAVLTGFSGLPLAISYLPILFARSQQDLAAEASQVDRRAFAAFANGGDLLNLLMPYTSGKVYETAREVPELGAFMLEYFTSPLTVGSEYVFYRGGVAVPAALALILLALLGAYRRQDLLMQVSPLPTTFKATLFVSVLCTAWYARGGLGTAFAFAVPQIRGYARAASLVTFCAFLVLALVASRRVTSFLPVRVLAAVLLVVAALDSVSTADRLPPQPSGRSYTVPSETGLTTALGGDGIVVRTLGPEGTKELVVAADARLPDGCTVLVLPIVQYPVDFMIGLPSYYAYEEIKPGLLPSDVNWSSGGFQGTPGNAFVDRWIGSYAAGDLESVLSASEGEGYCGTLFFSDLHAAFHEAGAARGSRYLQPAPDVRAALRARYGPPCHDDQESQVQLYCRA